MQRQKGFTLLELLITIVIVFMIGGLVSCVGGEDDPEDVVEDIVEVNPFPNSHVIDAETTFDTAKLYCSKFNSKVKSLSAKQIGLRMPTQRVLLTCDNTASYNGNYINFIKLAESGNSS